MTVTTFVWNPGKKPTPGVVVPEDAPPGTLLWVDAEGGSVAEVVAAVEPLKLPGLHRQMLWHLCSNVAPDDPIASDLYDGDDFDAGVAAQLVSGREQKLLQNFWPQLVVISGRGPRRTSYISARIGMLASVAGWLVTYRDHPLDLRFGGYARPKPVSRAILIDAAEDFVRTDQLPADVANLMRRRIALEAIRVSDEIDDELSHELHNVHRTALASDTPEAYADGQHQDEFEATRQALFDLRWVIDSHHASCRRQDPQRVPQVAAFNKGSRDPDVVAEVARRYEEAVAQSRASRVSMQEALGWLTSEQDAQSARRAERLQRLVGMLSVFVLGPTLVATIFGAQGSWFDGHAELRGLLMFALMGVTAVVGALVVGLTFGPVPDRPIDERPPNEPRLFSLRWYGWLLRWCCEEVLIGWHIATGSLPRE